MSQKIKEIVECVKINDSLKEVHPNIITLNPNNEAFILCHLTFVNYPNLDFKKIINKQIKVDFAQIVDSSPTRLNISFDEILALKKNNIEFFIVNKPFLINLGFPTHLFTIPSDIYFFIVNSIKHLYFKNDNKLFIIESGNPRNQLSFSTPIPNINQNNNINIFPNNKQNINISININDYRIDIINSSVLLYTSAQTLLILFNKDLPVKYNLKSYKLINKEWLDSFKHFYYNKLKNLIIKYSQTYQFNSYKEYMNNLHLFQSIPEIQDIVNSFGISDTLANKINIIPIIKLLNDSQTIKYPLNFELVHESLFNILKKFRQISNEKDLNFPNYKIILGIKTLYLKSQDNPNNDYFIYEYNVTKGSYILLAMATFPNETIFPNVFNRYLKTNSFMNYMLIKKIDLNKKNKKQDILNSSVTKIGEIIILVEINQFNNNQIQEVIKKSINTKNQNEQIHGNNFVFNNNINNNNINNNIINNFQENNNSYNNINKNNVNNSIINNVQENNNTNYL